MNGIAKNKGIFLENYSFGRALGVQIRVVGALTMRELQTRYGRDGLGYLWALLEPLVLLVVLYLGFTLLGRTQHAGMDLVPFLAAGIVTFTSIRTTVGRLSSAIESNRGLLIYPHVTPLDTMIARAVLETATFIVVFIIIIGGAWLIDLSSFPSDAFGIVTALSAAMCLAFSWGMVQWGLCVIWPTFDKLTTVLWRILLWTSCVFYTLDDVPLQFRHYLELNPIVNIIELLRSAFFSGYLSPITSYGYVNCWILGFSFLGLFFERTLRGRALMS
ncbi:ABC transporter permease [Sneathiella marina]|uniref:Transport permease protein n=1 Tax=Sneathiella marina TaxID=2950108 RepID=A0ABY4W7C5_9PROT|nr:ABC transporter permease [Sneathiella marina]USG62799.1 ABC transporter permease [Sneathiella marina]